MSTGYHLRRLTISNIIAMKKCKITVVRITCYQGVRMIAISSVQ